MIHGIVSRYGEALVRLTVIGSSGQRRSIEAVVDTGYDGYLTLPSRLVAQLNWKWRRRAESILADGSKTSYDVFGGTVTWGRPPASNSR